MQTILTALKEQRIYVSDRWYRAVVDSGSLNYPSIYQAGQCPVAESVATRLLNLPTHIHVSPEDAERIAQIIVEHV
jgi:dTDP-4-amino-4,6-dideoxygalactose transaminase